MLAKVLRLASTLKTTLRVLGADITAGRLRHWEKIMAADWLLVSWIVVASGAMTSSSTTEKQCRAYITFVSGQPNMLMEATCIAPDGTLIHTTPLGQRKLPAPVPNMNNPKPNAKVEM